MCRCGRLFGTPAKPRMQSKRLSATHLIILTGRVFGLLAPRRWYAGWQHEPILRRNWNDLGPPLSGPGWRDQNRLRLPPDLPRLMEANRAEFAQQAYSNQGSLLFGDLGTALVATRVDPSLAVTDAIYARASANTALPIRELMWGMPGSMLACIFMSEMISEPRWRELYETQAARLLDQLEETDNGPLWTQDLYGSHHRWLRAVHGYAGNMIPLIRGWSWLTDKQRARVADAIPRTLSNNAWRGELGSTWHAGAGSSSPPDLCQHCHGAPGMVTTLADAPFRYPCSRLCCSKAGSLLGRLAHWRRDLIFVMALGVMVMRF